MPERSWPLSPRGTGATRGHGHPVTRVARVSPQAEGEEEFYDTGTCMYMYMYVYLQFVWVGGQQ